MRRTQVYLACLLFLMLSFSDDVGGEPEFTQDNVDDGDYEIIFPEEMFDRREKRSLDHTAEERKEHLRYKMNAFGKELVIDLHKNTITSPNGLLVRTFDEKGDEHVEMSPVDHCQYQGHIQGEPDSSVILDTCEGLRGIIDDSIEELSIEPIKSKGVNAHKLSRARKHETSSMDFKCGVQANEKSGNETVERSRRSLAIDPLFRSYIPKDKARRTRYTEAIIVIDKYLSDKYKGNKKDIRRRVLMLINAVDMIYQKINIRILLKELEIWDKKDLVPYNRNAGPDLANFQKYRKNDKDRYRGDVVHLMRGKMWDDHGGMAYMSEMCTIKSTGVVGWNYWSPLGPWLALAHEMGHNFGFDHDADGNNCKCLTPRGCIMNTFKTRVPGFSDCNLKGLQSIDDSCLYNIPQKVQNSGCGNGIKENNEECDCGTPETCAQLDRCCNPETCKLLSSSQCSDRHQGCCKNCQKAPAGTVCRRATSECDVPEICSGTDYVCPLDDFRRDGEACVINDLVLPGNKESSHVTITSLPRRFWTRYLRINPIHSKKDTCMKAEILGCNSNSASNRPTSIISSNKLCVKAKHGFKQASSELLFFVSDCKSERNSDFELDSSGVLTNTYTRNRVCSQDKSLPYGSKLEINSKCSQQDALKFWRDGNLLCLINKPTICIHPYGGIPRDDVALVLWKTNKTKSNDKIKLYFTNQDCLIPLGMEDSRIPNNRITASSNKKDKDPMHARLGGLYSWCAKRNNDKQYLQIDLGKVTQIGGIATEGTFDDKRVLEYKLLHSNDGQTWTKYTRTRKITKNSCCFRGTCSPLAEAPRCPSLKVASRHCPKPNGLECAGNGICTSKGKCHCNAGFDPSSYCATAVQVRNGGWGRWSKWSSCSRICDRGIERRYRFCSSPLPSNGGRGCIGKRIQKRFCKTSSCPVLNSCRQLQQHGRKNGIDYPSDVYTINPGNQGNIKTYCDMSRDGGGWTLLVTSHTNTWRPNNIRQRNTNNPSLNDDFSILYKANTIKDQNIVRGDFFEYRIEAQKFGRWGGIWKARRSYSFVATNNKQTNIELMKKFDKWSYEDYGIEERMPWINGSILTTSRTTDHRYAFGSIAANIKRFYPAPWINNKEMEQHPTNIWYWMREGETLEPKSCMDLQLLRIKNTPLKDGIYTITVNGQKIKTYCDFRTDGGAWTLLLTSSSQTGWTKGNLGKRNAANPALDNNFSILRYSNYIIQDKHFQYKIEDGTRAWGGIFEAEAGQTLLSTKPQTRTKLLRKLSQNWNKITSSLSKSIPYVKDRSLLYSTSTSSADNSGTLVSSSASSATFIPGKKKNPSVVRLWLREGTWGSCNEIKLKSKRNDLSDGVYMIKKTPHEYISAMCDMTSDPGAWTLLVTSATNGWKKDQVKYRNIDKPSLSRDYSILGLGDKIKSLSNGKAFKYKLEAHKHGEWGGIFEAPREYSFVWTNNAQRNVTPIKLFTKDKWVFDQWFASIEKRMPWLGKKEGLLTTSTHSDYYAYGTIISEIVKNNPAPWISPRMINPGLIWYWVNEDDCDQNRLPVHGDVSGWSTWSSCSPFCSVRSQQTRERTCTNPAPRCGGQQCAAAALAKETRRCKYCPRSPIRGDNNLCIHPMKGKCNPPDGTLLEYTNTNRNCNSRHMYFIMGNDRILIHQCSGKKVCPRTGGSGPPYLQLSSTCDPNESKFEQTPIKGLLHLPSGKCIHPNGGVAGDGVKLIPWTGCKNPAGTNKLKLDLFELPSAGRVVVIPHVTPTPKKQNSRVSAIRSLHGRFCLQPQKGQCSPKDGTAIIYHRNRNKSKECIKKYMKFTFTKQGVLKHTCSNMYVCPKPIYYDTGMDPWSGVPLVLKQNGCSPHKVFYKRTPSRYLRYKNLRYKNLRYKNTNMCVTPAFGSHATNATAVVMKVCNRLTSVLDFYELKP